MKRLAILVLLFMLAIPVLPAFADDSVNVVVTTGENTININVTCDVAEDGTMHLHINAVQLNQTVVNEYTTVNEYNEHNYDSDITYLNTKINGLNFNMIVFANYTDGKLSMLLVNDNCLVKWIGCLDNTTLIGRRIFDGNSTVVMELNRLTNDDAALNDMINRLTAILQQMDSRLTVETSERKKAEDEIKGFLEKLQAIALVTKGNLEITDRNLIDTRAELSDTRTQLEQMRLVLIAIGAVVVGLGIAYMAKIHKGKDQGLAAVR